jgi:hypothetical protein
VAGGYFIRAGGQGSQGDVMPRAVPDAPKKHWSEPGVQEVVGGGHLADQRTICLYQRHRGREGGCDRWDHRYRLAAKMMSRLMSLMPSLNLASSSSFPIELAAEHSCLSSSSSLPRASPLRYFVTRTRIIQANPSQHGRMQCGNARSPAHRADDRALEDVGELDHLAELGALPTDTDKPVNTNIECLGNMHRGVRATATHIARACTRHGQQHSSRAWPSCARTLHHS